MSRSRNRQFAVRQFAETIRMRSAPLKRLQAHRYFPVVLIAVAVLSAACIHVWQRVVVIGLVHEVALLQQEQRALVDDVEKVQSDLARLSMSSRIELYAADSLGMHRVTPNRLYTLVPGSAKEARGDEFATMLSSIKRVADYLPALTETQAGASELKPIRIEPTDEEGED
ncbi:hypothetical protein GF377_02440 [candidate division GN15 bacterium]|nr:hypothetical protein [candidate division GN15 bacterium]